MNERPVERDALLAGLPEPWADDPLPEIRDTLATEREKVVVLDDDPTGTQTVHDVPVLTRWSAGELTGALAENATAVFMLTNSRSLDEADACVLNGKVAAALRQATQDTGKTPAVVSRGDSTLRGHYPAEVRALAEALGRADAATLIVPFFAAGGRLTVGDVHYVAEGEQLIPAGQTPFAEDAAFGYRASNLREWVEEKTAGRIGKEDVASISIEELRNGGPDRVVKRLTKLRERQVCVVNAACERDVEVAALAGLRAESAGRPLLYRTAASFARALAGIEPRPVLTPRELKLTGRACPQRGGLIVCGSHVPKSTRQLKHLFTNGDALPIQLAVPRLVAAGQRGAEVARAAGAVRSALAAGRRAAVFTSRALVSGEGRADNLDIAHKVSQALVEIVAANETRPRYILAKGGITSSDLATEALGVRRAWVVGQIHPGVPLWRLGEESKFPGLPYVVFPGNVGDDAAVTDVVRALT